MRILQGRNDANPDTADKYGQTPLSWAARNGHKVLVRALPGRDDVSPYTAKKYGQTPLSWAVRNGSDRIAMLLPDQTSSILRYAAAFQPTQLFSPEPSKSFEPPSKRTR